MRIAGLRIVDCRIADCGLLDWLLAVVAGHAPIMQSAILQSAILQCAGAETQSERLEHHQQRHDGDAESHVGNRPGQQCNDEDGRHQHERECRPAAGQGDGAGGRQDARNDVCQPQPYHSTRASAGQLTPACFYQQGERGAGFAAPGKCECLPHGSGVAEMLDQGSPLKYSYQNWYSIGAHERAKPARWLASAACG